MIFNLPGAATHYKPTSENVGSVRKANVFRHGGFVS
jgi:hypothetical protein